MPRIILKILLITLLVSLIGTILAIPVIAAGLKSGDIITIGKGEVVDDDQYLAAQTIIVDGTVNGDIFAVAQEIIINGTVNGGVTLAGNTITISGTITNGARLAGQKVTVSGRIGRDLVVAGSVLNVSSSGSVKRDLVFGFQTAQIEGTVDGNVKGGASKATMAGKVGGDADLTVDRLILGPTAILQGKLTYRSNNQADVQSGAQVRGTTARLPPPANRGSDIPSKILGFFMITATGIIALLLFGSARLTKLAGEMRTKPWSSLGWGALLLVGVPIAVFIVLVTVIGLPLGLMTLALYLAALYLSQIPVALFVGRLIMKGDAGTEHKSRTVLVLIIGLAVLLILGLIPVIDVVVGLATVLLGLGSLISWLTSKKPAAPVVPAS